MQSQVTNSTVIGGHLDVVQGYLVYKFFMEECRKPNRIITPIDAGNGNVPYTSKGQPISSFSPIFGYPGLMDLPSARAVESAWMGNVALDEAPRIYQSTSINNLCFLSFFLDEKQNSKLHQ